MQRPQRQRKAPFELIRHAWRLGISEERVWIPRAMGFLGTTLDEVMRDMATRAEKRALVLGDGAAARCTDVFGSLREEARRYDCSRSTVDRAKRLAGVAVEAWWYAGERERYQRLTNQKGAARSLLSYELAREAMIRGELPHDLSREIVALAAESVAAAWWHREERGQEALIEEVAYLAVVRLDGRLDMRKAEALARSRLADGGMDEDLAGAVERGVIRGVEAVERWGNVA